MRPKTSLLALALASSLFAAGCGKEASAPAAGGSGKAAPSDVAAVRTELRSELGEAREHVAAKHLDKLHGPAAHIWGLAAKLRAAKAPYGRLFKLARDLDEQGDSGNASGAAEVVAAIEREIAKPSADVPDDGKPMTAGEHKDHEKKDHEEKGHDH